MSDMRSHLNKLTLIASALLLTPAFSFAQTAAGGKEPSYNAFLIGLVSLAIILLFAVMVLGNTLRQLGFVYRDKIRAERNSGNTAKTVLALLAVSLSSNIALAQADIVAPAVSNTISGIAKTDFYLLMGIIAIELTVIFALSFQLRKIIILISGKEEATSPFKPKLRISFWDRFNKAVAVEKEQDIMLDHDYDGIKELDNSLPPWWKYGFYLTIVIGVVYVWYYHAGGNGPSSYDEYVAEVEKGEEAKAAYLAKAASLVDENSVVMADAAGIASGAAIFKTACAACHATDGGGGVGPNLADEYWLHGGSIQDVFKSIKYGWPDKGMKSWKDDFSPRQIAELSSYIRSLKGTTPAAPKEKQGEFYTESEPIEKASDSTGTGKVALN